MSTLWLRVRQYPRIGEGNLTTAHLSPPQTRCGNTCLALARLHASRVTMCHPPVAAFYPRLLNHRDGLNLHQIIRARQASDDEQCAGGGIGRETLLTDLTYGGGVVEIGDIRRRLHNIVERATYGLDGGL